MFINYKDLFKYPFGIKVRFNDKDLYYVGSSSIAGKMFWNEYNIIYEDELELNEDTEIFVYEFDADKAIEILYKVYVVLYLLHSVEEPFMMKDDIEFLRETIKNINLIRNKDDRNPKH